MRLDPRPSPNQVDACFASDLTDDALRGYLLTLEVDPNWRVVATPGPATWDLALMYAPAGTHLHVHLERVERAWEPCSGDAGPTRGPGPERGGGGRATRVDPARVRLPRGHTVRPAPFRRVATQPPLRVTQRVRRVRARGYTHEQVRR